MDRNAPYKVPDYGGVALLFEMCRVALESGLRLPKGFLVPAGRPERILGHQGAFPGHRGNDRVERLCS